MPQGRLTIAAGAPLLGAETLAINEIRYTPYVGFVVPVWNGTSIVGVNMTSELSQTLADTTKSPAAAVASSVYDIFFWLDGAVPRISRGPKWASTTSRGAGTGTSELTRIGGVLVNANAITNGPVANRGTYLGTLYTNAATALEFLPSVGLERGQPAKLPYWNAYNRVPVSLVCRDTSTSWSVNPGGVYVYLHANGVNRAEVVVGLDGQFLTAHWNQLANSSGAGNAVEFALMLDSLTALFGAVGRVDTTFITTLYMNHAAPVGPGFHYLAQCERMISGGTPCGAYGQSGGYCSSAMVLHWEY